MFSGKGAIAQYWQDIFREAPQAHSEIEEIFGLGERCIMRWKYSWVDQGDVKDHARGVDVFRVRNGLISERLSYIKG